MPPLDLRYCALSSHRCSVLYGLVSLYPVLAAALISFLLILVLTYICTIVLSFNCNQLSFSYVYYSQR